MKIAVWNVERLKHKKDLDKILLQCEQVKADIFVLTETDARVCLDFPYSFHTPMLSEIKPEYYAAAENRVSVFSRYPCVRQYETFDSFTALCVELETERGKLLVYGTVIGIFGNRHSSFRPDLIKQIEDIKRLSAEGKSLCVCGDFNCSFADNYYFTGFARESLNQSFLENDICLLTGDRSECIDHIAVSRGFITDYNIRVEEWNWDKKLSDHKGIAAEFEKIKKFEKPP